MLTIRIGSKTLCQTETALDRPFAEILKDLQSEKFRLLTTATLLRLAIVRKDPFSLEQVFELIDEVGHKAVSNAIAEALIPALGWDKGEKKGSENPPEAPDGASAS